MNANHLKKAVLDPEVGQILRYATQPYMARIALLKVIEPYAITGKPIPEHLGAGLNTRCNEDIVPNVVSTFITNLEVEDAKAISLWTKINVFIYDRWLLLTSGADLLLRNLASRS